MVAIKILRKKEMKPESYEMVRNEIEALKLCQHPNIVRLYDVLENVDYIFLVMELLRGGTLRDFVKQHKGALDEAMVKQIIRSLAFALEYMEKYGIVHRDLKLINVLLAGDPFALNVKLVDFGLAAILAPGQKCHSFAGTLHFCAPEVILGIPYAHSVDVWGLGVITYYLLFRKMPFIADNDCDLKRYDVLPMSRTFLKDDPPIKLDKQLSQPAKDFLQGTTCTEEVGVLMKNAKYRLTIKQVLEHPWLCDYT